MRARAPRSVHRAPDAGVECSSASAAEPLDAGADGDLEGDELQSRRTPRVGVPWVGARERREMAHLMRLGAVPGAEGGGC